MTYSAYGVEVALATSTSLWERLPSPLLPGASLTGSATGKPMFRLGEVETPQGRTWFSIGRADGAYTFEGSVETAALQLESLMQQYVAESAGDFAFVHAGVVTWRGKAILLPGRSFSGKSTLVMALLAAGAAYYSDEYAVIDASGFVHPFQRRPRLRPDMLPHRRERPLLATGGDHAAGPVRAGLVLKSCYHAQAVWNPRRLTPGETWLALVENTVAVRSQIDFSVQALRALSLSAKGMQSERGEAAAVAGQILELCEEK